jgi:DNA-binding MarR family transcriptional regulator
VSSANSVEYKVQIGVDVSAVLDVTQLVESGFSYDTIQRLKTNLTILVEKAEEKCGRQMNAWIDEVNIIPQNNYVLVKYKLMWKNFSRFENSKIIVGDVFQVENFFSYLFGDGAIYFSYPHEYDLTSAVPKPDEADYSLRTLKWFSAERFSSQNPYIIFTKSSSNMFLESVLIYAIPISLSAASLITLFYFKRRKSIEKVIEPKFPQHIGVENAEEKIIRTIRAAGGCLFQSQITEQCKFSKAKTSQLLSALEKRGIIRRQKRGRDKLVILAEKGGEKS